MPGGYYHIVDKSTGQILEVVSMGSDVSRFDTSLVDVIPRRRYVDPKAAYYSQGHLTRKVVVTLEPDKWEIKGNGNDECVVTVKAKVSAVVLKIGDDQEETVMLSRGVGKLSPIVGTEYCYIRVGVKDTVSFWCDPIDIKVVQDV
jgi:hypothetical protein